MASMIDEPIEFNTLSIHAGEEPDPATGALTVPLHMSTAFKLPGFGIKLFEALELEGPGSPYVYTRWGNPTAEALEERLAALEGAEAALVTASGTAAISALFLTLLSAGDHVIASEVCYAGTQEMLGVHLPRLGIETSLVNSSAPDEVSQALRQETKLIYVETPANPILRLADIAALARIAHGAGVPLAVDSTFAGPVLQKPLAMGADYVVHSLTKSLNGHGDALGGAILGDREALQRIRREMLVYLGGAMSPFNAWMTMRGLTTLPLRMARHCQNAMELAHFLADHPRVDDVIYPGLPTHPHHELAQRQMTAFGGMLAFRPKGGMRTAISMAERVRLWTYATSFGHPRSLLYYYPTDIFIDEAPYLNAAQKAGVRRWMGDGIVRASVGLEDIEDLKKDLDQALRARTFKGLFGSLAYRAGYHG